MTPTGEILWSRNYLDNGPGYPDWIGIKDKKGFEHENGDIIFCGTTDRQCLFPEFVLLRVDEEGNLATDENEIPTANTILSNYPNPFNPSTTIMYDLGDYTGEATIEIYNVRGQRICELKIDPPSSFYGATGNVKCKINSIVWDGSGFASGIYFYRIRGENYSSETQKMILVK